MSDRHEDDETPPDVGRGHETRDISTRVVTRFALALVVGGVIVQFAVWGLYGQFARSAARADPREYPMARVGAPQWPPEPRLQTRPREDLDRLRAGEDLALDSYGWVDAQRGLVRIPIAQAMAEVVAQGLPARAGAAPCAPPVMPDKSNSGRTLPPAER